MKSLWTERINPEPMEAFEPTEWEFEMAMDWVDERDSSGEFIRAGMCIILVHNHINALLKKGVKDAGKIALVGLWRRYGVKRQLPQRKTASEPILTLPRRK